LRNSATALEVRWDAIAATGRAEALSRHPCALVPRSFSHKWFAVTTVDWIATPTSIGTMLMKFKFLASLQSLAQRRFQSVAVRRALGGSIACVMISLAVLPLCAEWLTDTLASKKISTREQSKLDLLLYASHLTTPFESPPPATFYYYDPPPLGSVPYMEPFSPEVPIAGTALTTIGDCTVSIDELHLCNVYGCNVSGGMVSIRHADGRSIYFATRYLGAYEADYFLEKADEELVAELLEADWLDDVEHSPEHVLGLLDRLYAGDPEAGMELNVVVARMYLDSKARRNIVDSGSG
jgi:hypothetical protein